ncbi:CD151 antigen isoform X2 [Anabas testudineus]|nr:CD151 antigen isoform X2 [Anabas testudineus]
MMNQSVLKSHIFNFRMEARREKTHTCGVICLKYLLFLFNSLFWLAGGAVLAVGLWTLVEKSDYISLLNSNFYAASAYILIAAGVIVIVTGILGCCATLKEMKSLLIVYLILLICIFLLEIVAGVLAYVNHQELDEELRQNLKVTMQQKYNQPGEESVTHAVDKLQQEFKCCGSSNFSDWRDSAWIQAPDNKRLVPDSCCKTPSELCGQRNHPSNIYRVEGGCIMKLEDFILSQLYILSAVGIGIAFLQLVGMMFTCCLYRNLKEDSY